MKTVSFTHACPVEVQSPGPMGTVFPCEADVIVQYEAGRSRDDFFSTADDEYCERGHRVPDAVTASWYEEDAVEYGTRLYEQYEAMKYYHESGGL